MEGPGDGTVKEADQNPVMRSLGEEGARGELLGEKKQVGLRILSLLPMFLRPGVKLLASRGRGDPSVGVTGSGIGLLLGAPVERDLWLIIYFLEVISLPPHLLTQGPNSQCRLFSRRTCFA